MKKLLGILVLGLLWCNVGFAAPVSHYLELGYKLHSTNISDDGSVIIYHLILDLGKTKDVLVTCVADPITGKTVKCFSP